MTKWTIPPASRSEDITRRVEQLLPEHGQNIPQQHVVSKVVLKGFADRGKANQFKLTPFDLKYGRQLKARSPTRCGRVPNFLKFASRSAEQIWGEVENGLPAAIQAAQNRRLRAVDAETLSDCIALHVVRSIRYMKIHTEAVRQTLDELPRRILETRRSVLDDEFLRQYGVHAAGPEARLLIAEGPISKWRDHETQGVIARQSMEEMYGRVRSSFRQLAVEIHHTPSGHEFLISDSPAFVARRQADGTLQPDVAIGDAHTVGMPVTRNCLITIGPDTAGGNLTSGQVELLHRLQVIMADRFVYYRPSSNLRLLVEAAMPLRQATR